MRSRLESGDVVVTAEIGPPRNADPDAIRGQAEPLRGWGRRDEPGRAAHGGAPHGHRASTTQACAHSPERRRQRPGHPAGQPGIRHRG
jgi:hypothetical protein